MSLTGAPRAPDFNAAAQQQQASSQQATAQQTAANRPNQSNAIGGYSNWVQGADGQWTQQSGLNGPLGGAAAGLQGQAANALANPLDFSSLGPMMTGDAARDQAITAAYGQATSRLDPRFAQQEESLRTRLANQGLEAGSEAFGNEMQNFGQQRNDAYGSAMNSAIMQGQAAGDSVFRNSLAARQQGGNEMMTARSQPLNELAAMLGLSGQSGFQGAGRADPLQSLAAAMGQGNLDMARWQAENQMGADAMGGGMSMVASLLPFLLSDERLKKNIQRLDVEALPGVPYAVWEWIDPACTHPTFGVIAQDLQRVAPQYVHEAPDGTLMVDPVIFEEGA